LRRLFGWLKTQGVTALITGERGEHSLTRQGLEEYVSDCVIKLEQKTIDELATRTLQIVKYRGSRHSNNEYPFLIEENGISVLPITSLTLEHTVSNERVSTGIAELDIMFDGEGYYRGSSILATGKAGTGKTTLAAYFAQSTCLRGERCLYLATEESPQQIVRNLTSVGFDLDLYIKQGLLQFDAVRPTNYSLEMRLFKIHRWLESFQPTTIIIDPMSSLILSGNLIQTKSFFTRLIDYLKSKQITIFMTDLTPGEGDVEHEGAAIRISSLMDTWIDLQVVKTNGERNRILYILKSRGMAHSNQLREFILTDAGVKLVEAYIGEGNVLTGTERMNKEIENKLVAKQLVQKFELKRQVFEQEKYLLEAQLKAIQMQLSNKNAELIVSIEEEEERIKMLLERQKFMKELREAHR
jgi:circadian clock protein KaiC